MTIIAQSFHDLASINRQTNLRVDKPPPILCYNAYVSLPDTHGVDMAVALYHLGTSYC